MKTFAFCFVALFTTTFAAAFFDEAELEDIDDRIIGGKDTTIRAYPYILSLRYSISPSHLCGETILSTTAGLTSANCLEKTDAPSKYSILAGSTTHIGDGNQQTRTLSRFLIHPEFDAPKFDIAILHWIQPFVFGSNIRAIGLPEQGTVEPEEKPCNVAGWGLTKEGDGDLLSNVLQHTTVRFVSNVVCNQPRKYQGKISDDMLCAGVEDSGRGPCNSDGGGPLVYGGALYGLVSWGFGCARPDFPGVYVRIPFFTNWICQNLS